MNLKPKCSYCNTELQVHDSHLVHDDLFIEVKPCNCIQDCKNTKLYIECDVCGTKLGDTIMEKPLRDNVIYRMLPCPNCSNKKKGRPIKPPPVPENVEFTMSDFDAFTKVMNMLYNCNNCEKVKVMKQKYKEADECLERVRKELAITKSKLVAAGRHIEKMNINNRWTRIHFKCGTCGNGVIRAVTGSVLNNITWDLLPCPGCKGEIENLQKELQTVREELTKLRALTPNPPCDACQITQMIHTLKRKIVTLEERVRLGIKEKGMLVKCAHCNKKLKAHTCTSANGSLFLSAITCNCDVVVSLKKCKKCNKVRGLKKHNERLKKENRHLRITKRLSCL